MKKLYSLLTFILICGMLALAGCNTPSKNVVSDFTLDVNPEIDVQVNANEEIVKVTAGNDDGKDVLNGMKLEGVDVEVGMNAIIGSMFVKGYLNNESNSVLVSFKTNNSEEIAEKVTTKINDAFESAGVAASIIQQDLTNVADDVKKEIDETAKKYDISKGKAKLVQEICDEFPEYEVEDLVTLKINDLNLLLENINDDVQDEIKRFGERASEKQYIGKNAALENSFSDAGVTKQAVSFKNAYLSRYDGKMVYYVTFYTKTTDYRYILDAATGEVLSKNTYAFEEFNIQAEINNLFGLHADIVDAWNKEHPDHPIYGNKTEEVTQVINDVNNIINDVFDIINGKDNKKNDKEDKENNGNNENATDKDNSNNGKNTDDKKNNPVNAILKRSEVITELISKYGLDRKSLKTTDVSLLEENGCKVFRVVIILKDGTNYNVYVEAGSGIVLRAECNGKALE